MKRNLLPLHRSGWLYFLLAVWACVFWVNQQGGFNSLNQINRDLLFRLLPAQAQSEQVIRLSSTLQNSELANIKRLLQSQPQATLVLLGNSSEGLVERLGEFVNQINHANGLIVARKDTSSGATLNLAAEPTFLVSYLLDWHRYQHPESVQWKTSSRIVYSPTPFSPQDGISLFWRWEDKLYLSLLGEIVRNVLITNDWQLNTSWGISWRNQSKHMELGASGKIFSAGNVQSGRLLSDFLSDNQSAKPQLIFLDDKSVGQADQLVRSSEQLIAGQYIYQNLFADYLPFLLLVLGIALLWIMRERSTLFQSILLLSYLVLTIVIQYIAFTQMLWLAIVPSVMGLVFALAAMLAYRRECQSVNRLYQQHNQLIGESIGVFYQTQKIDKVQPMLEQTIGDARLAEKVFDVALQAETNNNRPLAKYLHSWIQDSGIAHEGSRERLKELEPPPAPEGSPDLDSTMVIGPGQTGPQTTSSMAIPVSHFGRYEVEGILGKGAMGIVYQGVDPKINRHVAIKTLQLSDSVDHENFAETKDRFFREAETAGNLSHANIVTIYDVGEEGELGYIAMDLLTGAPLSEFVKPENKLPAPFVYQLMIQITDALDYAHKQNVVHRDIKPGNIILDDEIQRVTVTDFGIAFVADNSKTRTGTIMGSPFYMSPEQVLGKRVDGRSDIFSLGVTFYQLLSGHLPFNGESIASVAYHITKTKQASVRQWDSKLPASAARITNKALQKDASKRYQTMDEFKQVLINALKRDFKKAPIV